MNDIDGIKKYKASISLGKGPVYIFASNEMEAKSLLATTIMVTGTTVTDKTNLQLEQVDYSMEAAKS